MEKVNNPGNLNAFIEKCKERNLKITPQRTAIYKALIKAVDHPSADVIYQAVKRKFPNISFDTVNRTLLTFSEIGIIDVVEGRGDPRRFDPNLDSHHHFCCIRCGEIMDFYHEAFDKLVIPGEIRQKFTVSGMRVVLKGLCDRCR